HPLIFLSLTGILVCASYMLFVNDLALSFWGLRGDEVTIAAMFQMFAHGSFVSDFAFPELVPWYPPLFFWIGAVFGNIFNWNGVQMMKASVAGTLLLFPVFVYGIQAWYWKTVPKEKLAALGMTPQKMAWMLVPFIFFILLDWDAFILKPYEVITAFGSVLWIVALLQDLHSGVWSKKRLAVYAVSGGVLFMMYYLWLIFGAIAVALSGLFVPKKDQWKFYGRLLILGASTFIATSPYLVPLIATYHKLGTENWAVAFMVMKGLVTQIPFITLFSWRGVVLMCGFVSMLLFRKNVYMRSLLLLTIAGYIWQIMGWVTIVLFASPLQEFKPFDFYYYAIFSFAAAYGIERMYTYLVQKYAHIEWRIVLGVPALALVSVYMIFGTFIDDPVVQARRVQSRSLSKPMSELIAFLEQDEENLTKKTLGPGSGEMYAFTPMNNYIYFTQHNNHPATRFSEKKVLLELLAKETDPAVFASSTDAIAFGPIDRFILFKNTKSPLLWTYFFVDTFPHGGGDAAIGFPEGVFVEPYFTRVFENSTFVVFERQSA
ncbi:MAG: hypothetical protein KBD15_02360, partial [Candidatus Magasanikbacteria bacterium]|nr:hypothetical protein [Candidatus Magasanikbacteria bacterium]